MQYFTERQIYNWRMGKVLTDDYIENITPKRYRADVIARLNDSDTLWVFCDICKRPFVVNAGFEDRKPRTPRYKDFIICIQCDPRHPDDRFMKQGWRIMSKPKLRIVQMAQIVRQMGTWECKNPNKIKCNCAVCVAKKLFPPF